MIIFVLLFKIGGQYTAFTITQHKIHKQIKHLVEQQIPNNYLHKIIINHPNQIRWTKKDKEFWYQGFMYDIVRSEKHNNAIMYYCIQDRAESDLVKNFQKNQQDNQQNSQDSILNWDFAKKIVAIDFPFINFATQNKLFFIAIHKEKFVSFYNNFYQFHFFASIDFPPEIAY